jgi:hypothetical protein
MYLANNSTWNTDDTTGVSTVSGMNGAFESGALTVPRTKRILLPRSLQPNEKIEIEGSFDGNNWTDIYKLRGNGGYCPCGAMAAAGGTVGVGVNATTSSYIDIYFGLFAACTAAGTERGWSYVFTTGFYWRVRIGQAGLSEVKPSVKEGWYGATMPESATVPLKPDVKEYGAASNFNPSTGLYTSPWKGMLNLSLTASNASTGTHSVFKNGVVYKKLVSAAAGFTVHGVLNIPVNTNDTIEVRYGSSVTTTEVSMQFELTPD